MRKINVSMLNKTKLNKSVLYVTADVFTFNLHVGCTEHIRVGKAGCSMFVWVIGCTQCIQSSTCLIQKYPVSYVTSGHCAVFLFFCTRVITCMHVFKHCVKQIYPTINISHELLYCRTFKYTVYNDQRNKRSCTVHQSTNIETLKVCSQVWIKLHIFRMSITVGGTLAKQACKIPFLFV